MTGSFPLLNRLDVSFDKLVELERVLLGRTRAGLIPWKRHGDEFSLSTPSAVVSLTPDGIRVFNDSGVLLHQFRYETNALYEAASDWHENMRTVTLDAMLADLEELTSHA